MVLLLAFGVFLGIFRGSGGHATSGGHNAAPDGGIEGGAAHHGGGRGGGDNVDFGTWMVVRLGRRLRRSQAAVRTILWYMVLLMLLFLWRRQEYFDAIGRSSDS